MDSTTLLSSALFSRPLFISQSLDESRVWMQDSLNEHRLRVTAGALDVSLYRRRFGSLCFIGLRYGAEVEIQPCVQEDFFLLQLPLTGGVAFDCDSRRHCATPRTGALLSPGRSLSISWLPDSTQLLVKIPAAAMRRVCESLLARPHPDEIRFDVELGLESPAGLALLQLVAYLLAQSDATSAGRAYVPGEEMLLTHLLMHQASTVSAALQEPPRPAAPRYVRAAERLMREQLSSDWCLTDIAEKVGVCARTLSHGFAVHHGTPPMRFLQGLRLEAVRQDLLAGKHATVASAAMQWGFNHLGRFADAYRRKYGEAPAATLRRH